MIQQHIHMRNVKDGEGGELFFARIIRQEKHPCLIPSMCARPAEVKASVISECIEAVRFESASHFQY